MDEIRRYQRYGLDNSRKSRNRIKLVVGGESVRFVNFSVGGLYLLSKKPFSPGIVRVSVDFGKKGKISLIGRVVRVKQEGDKWGVAIDLSKTYKLDALRTL